MNNIDKIFLRANIQQIRSFFLDGVDLDHWYEDEACRSYEQRMREAERPMWSLLENTFPKGAVLDEAADKFNCALLANQHAFMEIGLKAGAALMFELLQEKPGAGCKAGKAGQEK